MIKNIENLKRCQIVCRNQKDIEDCLNMLEELGFEVRNNDNKYKVIYYSYYNSRFENDIRLECEKDTYFFNKKFVKILQKFIKQKEEKEQVKEEEKVKDFEVASDGRIIKVNNWDSGKYLYFIVRWDYINTHFDRKDIEYYVNLGLAFISRKARDKAIFKMEIETKLKNIAERLNKGQKIDWEDEDQAKFNIYYDFDDDGGFYCCLRYSDKYQGAIYCLDKNFLDVAKQEIGEENLIKYFKEDFN